METRNIELNMKVICPYCGSEAKLVTGEVIRPRKPNLHSMKYWYCEPCNAWTGCHNDGGAKPIGSLANKELRKARSLVHKSLDLIMKLKNLSRTDTYKWLSNQLGSNQIWNMDINECSIAISICMMEINNSPSKIRAKFR